MKKVITLALLAVLVWTAAVPAAASDPYRGYSYSTTDEGTLDVAAPQAYLPAQVWSGANLETALSSPADLLFDGAGNLYVCDSGRNAVLVFSPQMQLLKTIDSFTWQGKTDTFSAPGGIFVTECNELYVADTGNGRVVALDEEQQAFLVVENPQSELLDETFSFQPQKVLVDSTDRLFVLSKNVNEGIMQFTSDGRFLGFFGSNTVTASLIDRIWKEIMTEEQTGKLTQFVPVEYQNFSLDYKGFIYAVTKVSDVGAPIRRLNLFGGDVLVRAPIDGSEQVVGDVSYPYGGVSGITGPSSFVDITSDELGNYYALDSKRGRVFAYDEEGNLLFVFGALNSGQTGSFSSPVAIVYHDHRVWALDKANAEIIVFEATEYAETMEQAMQAYLLQDYETSLSLWEQIIRRNNNCDLAYYKAGYCLYRMKDYKKAMEYFKLVNAKKAYSEARTKQTRIDMNENFETIATAAIATVAVLVGVIVVLRIRRHRKGKGETA